jgi:hypothetical protein
MPYTRPTKGLSFKFHSVVINYRRYVVHNYEIWIKKNVEGRGSGLREGTLITFMKRIRNPRTSSDPWPAFKPWNFRLWSRIASRYATTPDLSIWYWWLFNSIPSVETESPDAATSWNRIKLIMFIHCSFVLSIHFPLRLAFSYTSEWNVNL